jgi:hypothetical protein
MIYDLALGLGKPKFTTYPPTNIEFSIDETTKSFKFINVEGRKLSIKNGCESGNFPVLLAKAPIQNRKFFEVEITNAVKKWVMLGVTLFEHRNKPNVYSL